MTQSMRATRVLVTGAQGFCGSYLVAQWLDAEPDAIVLGVGRSPELDDTFTHSVRWAGRPVPAPLTAALRAARRSSRYRYERVDLHDRPALVRLLQEFRPDCVVHLACALRDEPSERLFATNVGATVALLDAIAGSGIDTPRVVLGSSGSIYGSPAPEDLPIREHARSNPVDLHAVSKRAGEDAARVVASMHEIPVVFARIFNPVGPGQDERHLCGWLASQAAAIAEGLAPAQIEVGPLETTRDFIDARDVASALRLLANRSTPGVAYNVASGRETHVSDVLRDVLDAAGIRDRVGITRRAGRRADIPRHFADVAQLTALGWRPEVSLAQSLGELVSFYRDDVAREGRRATARAANAPSEADATCRFAVNVVARHEYSVELAPGLLETLPARLAQRFASARFVLLTDATVHRLYTERLLDRMRAHGLAADAIVVPDGDTSKSLDQHARVIERMHALQFDRRAVLVCVGGGMITDLGGFVASSYMRGIAYVNVPTTLLAQHDSAIGGKVAVNTEWAKNFVGAFHHPRAVYCDPRVLETLCPRNVAAGIAECIKVAMTGDTELFELLETSADACRRLRDPVLLARIVGRSAARKIELLAPDPYEVDLRRVLNLGHTFGHALETELQYEGLLHGEAVGFGIAVATAIAQGRNVCPTRDAERIYGVLAAYGLPPRVARARLLRSVSRLGAIRLVRGKNLNFVMPERVGALAIVPEVPDAEFEAALERIAAHPVIGACVEADATGRAIANRGRAGAIEGVVAVAPDAGAPVMGSAELSGSAK